MSRRQPVFLTIGQIDKPRQPIDGPTGAGMVLVYCLIVAMVISI